MALTEFPEIPPFVPDEPQKRLDSKFLRDIQNWVITSQTRAYTAIVDKKGSAGNFTDIQAAINYVNGLGGGIVFIRAGTYLMTDNIVLYDTITLKGEDKETTILDFQSQVKNIRATGTASVYKKNIQIENLQIKDSDMSWDGAVNFQFIQFGKVSNCKIISCAGSGVHLDDSDDCIVTHNYFESCQQSVRTYYADRSLFAYNYIKDMGVYGILVCSGVNNKILYNYIIGTLGVGIMVDAGNGFEIHGNHIPNYDSHGIYLGSAALVAYGSIIGNWVDSDGNETGHGIFIEHGSHRLRIVGNYISSSVGDGINTNDLSNSVISGNIIDGGVYGIQFTVNSNYNEVVGNNLDGGTGPYLDSGTGNEFAHNM